jgi:hypothetical protein
VPFSDAEISCLQSQRLARMRITPSISWRFNLEGQPMSDYREVAVGRNLHRTGHEQNSGEAR